MFYNKNIPFFMVVFIMHHLSFSAFDPLAQVLESGYDHGTDLTPGIQDADIVEQFQRWAGIDPVRLLQGIGHKSNQAKLHLPLDHQLLQNTFCVHTSSLKEYEQQQNSVIIYQFYVTLFGDVLIAKTEEGICYLGFTDPDNDRLSELKQMFPHSSFLQKDDLRFNQAIFYFETGLTQSPIDLYLKGSPFQLKVWQALLSIPQGTLKSYGQIADAIDHPKAYRAVGTAVGQNPVTLIIPCHRVIQSSGAVGHFSSLRRRKIALLCWEMMPQ